MGELAIRGGSKVLEPKEHGTWPQLGEEEREGVLRVLERGILSGGDAPEARAFEEEMARFVGAKHALLTHSGTSALQVALGSVGVGEGDEVIIPAYSFIATAVAVLQQGAIPRFVDVRPDTGNLDPALLEAEIGPRTRAIMPVHVHGCPADMDPINRIAEAHGLLVVEDAAQAHGARYHGRPAGTLGAAAGFSLQSSKNLCAGEGGVFVTDDPARLERANRVRNFGLDLTLDDRAHYDLERPLDGHRSLVSVGMGQMARGNELMAAVARAQLAKLPARMAAASANASRLSERLRQLPGVTPPVVPEGVESVHHKFRVAFDLGVAEVEAAPRDFRAALMKALAAEGVNAVLWQDDALTAHPLLAELEGYGRGFPFRVAEDPEALRRSYDVARFPMTRALLDQSIVLFSQTRPLIAQKAEVVDRYADAFEKVWAHRRELVSITRG